MEKKYLLIIIVSCLFIGLLGIFWLGRRKGIRTRRERWLTKLSQSEETTPLATTTPTSPEPATTTPLPSSSPVTASYSYYRYISESEFNTYFSQAIAKPLEEKHPLVQENPFIQASLSMQEGVATLTMHFEKGQDLTGEVFVASDGKSLGIRNVTVSGTISPSTFSQLASDLIEGGFDDFIARIGESVQVVNIEIKPGQMVVYYDL